MRDDLTGILSQTPRRVVQALNLLRLFNLPDRDVRQYAQARASKFYGGENRELLCVVQVALNIPDRACTDDGEVAIKPGGNGVPK